MDVRPATPDMFDAIHDVLLEFAGGQLEKNDWRRIVDYRFGPERRDRGWVLVDDNRIVGFLGAIFSVRRGQRFCNLTSWAVKKSHRTRSLNLLLPMLEMKDHTLLNLSPNPFTVAVFRRMGFSELEDRAVIIPPIVPQRAPRGYDRVTDPKAIEGILEGEDLAIFRDHRDYACTHLVFAGPHRYSYVVAAKTRFRRYPTSYIYYRSDAELFRSLLGPMQRALWSLHRTPFSIIDARLTAAAPLRGCLTRKLMQPRLYRPAERAAPAREQIDSLYSEFVLLDPRRWTFNY